MLDSLLLQEVDDDENFLNLQQSSDDADWLTFLNVDMPGLFPDINKELQDNENTSSSDADEKAEEADVDTLVIAPQSSLILADKLAQTAATCSKPSSIPSENLFLPLPSPTAGSGITLSVPNPLANRCSSPDLSIGSAELHHVSTPPMTKTIADFGKRIIPPAPVSPSLSSTSGCEESSSTPEPPAKKRRTTSIPPISSTTSSSSATGKVTIAPKKPPCKPNAKKPTTTTTPTKKKSSGKANAKKSSTPAPSSPTAVATTKKQEDSSPTENMTEEEIEEEKRQRNRDHARRSRRKKKMLQTKLQESSILLKNENAKLRDILHTKLDIAMDQIDITVQEQLDLPQKQFLLALQNPSNRVLNARTIQSLQAHAKKITLPEKKEGNEEEDEDIMEPVDNEEDSKEENGEEEK